MSWNHSRGREEKAITESEFGKHIAWRKEEKSARAGGVEAWQDQHG